jgi:ubiquinone/menaquinone biosynthesis C-methylase UbiE
MTALDESLAAPPVPGLTSTSHPMLPKPRQANLAREEFGSALKRVVSADLTPEMVVVYHRALAEHPEVGEPSSRQEIEALLADVPAQQMWTALRRVSQELLIDGISETVEQELPSLVARFHEFSAEPVGGSVQVNPDMPIPDYLTNLDVHCMPTGYYRDLTESDVAAGAMYDRLVFSYLHGQLGPLNDTKGRTLIENFLKRDHPDLRPAKILDMGCAVGHSTLPYVDAYPEAEVIAIDLGGPMVRYAHARAQALGKAVQFKQDNAEHTSFADESFDLIVSHILFHETSRTAMSNILAETWRLLKPGGMAVHAEYSQFSILEPITQYLLDWDTHWNNEPFWGSMRDQDLVARSLEAGFPAENIARPIVPVGRRLQLGKKNSRNGEFHLLVLTKPIS